MYILQNGTISYSVLIGFSLVVVPAFDVKPHDQVVGLRRTVTMHCSVTGIPQPTIIWSRTSNKPSGEKVTIPALQYWCQQKSYQKWNISRISECLSFLGIHIFPIFCLWNDIRYVFVWPGFLYRYDLSLGLHSQPFLGQRTLNLFFWWMQ